MDGNHKWYHYLKRLFPCACLGANLMSVRKYCAISGLEGFFDDGKVYLINEKDIVLASSHGNGVYTLGSVLPAAANEFAFHSNQVSIDKPNLNSVPYKILAETDQIMSEDSGDFNPTSKNQKLQNFDSVGIHQL